MMYPCWNFIVTYIEKQCRINYFTWMGLVTIRLLTALEAIYQMFQSAMQNKMVLTITWLVEEHGVVVF
jgi:hypothetical protein